MTMGFILRTIAEVAVVAFLIWGFLHEDKFIRFEDRLARIIAVNIRRMRHRRMLKKQGAVPVSPARSATPARPPQDLVPSAPKKPAASSPASAPVSRPVRRRKKRVPQNAA